MSASPFVSPPAAGSGHDRRARMGGRKPGGRHVDEGLGAAVAVFRQWDNEEAAATTWRSAATLRESAPPYVRPSEPSCGHALTAGADPRHLPGPRRPRAPARPAPSPPRTAVARPKRRAKPRWMRTRAPPSSRCSSSKYRFRRSPAIAGRDAWGRATLRHRRSAVAEPPRHRTRAVANPRRNLRAQGARATPNAGSMPTAIRAVGDASAVRPGSGRIRMGRPVASRSRHRSR